MFMAMLVGPVTFRLTNRPSSSTQPLGNPGHSSSTCSDNPVICGHCCCCLGRIEKAPQHEHTAAFPCAVRNLNCPNFAYFYMTRTYGLMLDQWAWHGTSFDRSCRVDIANCFAVENNFKFYFN